MGRPKLADKDKRQQVNFRLDPPQLARLGALAKNKGVSVPALAEKLVVSGMALFYHPMMQAELLQIFMEIMDEMQEVQSRNLDKPWSQDLTTWAACKMIFAKGPFARRNPDDWKEDDKILELWRAVTVARRSKQEAINLLSSIGVSVKPEKYHYPAGRRGLLGAKHVNALAGPWDNRIAERAAINAIENEAERAQALAIFGIVEKLDGEEAEAMTKWHNEISQYTEAEKEGVELYKEWRREVVKQQLSRGEVPNLEDYY